MGDDYQPALHTSPNDRAFTRALAGSFAPADGKPTWDGRFCADLMVPELRSRDRMGAIKELVDRLHVGGWVVDSLRFLQLVLEREDLQSTSVARGVVFPHARSRSVTRLGAAVGVSRTGIDFHADAAEGPVHLVCLFAIPEFDAPSYLSLLAEASAMFRNESFRGRLVASRTPGEMLLALNRSLARSSAPAPAAG